MPLEQVPIEFPSKAHRKAPSMGPLRPVEFRRVAIESAVSVGFEQELTMVRMTWGEGLH